MSDHKYKPRGLYFEEIEVGKGLVTAGRTITESDIVAFAGLSGDFNQLHVDAEYARVGEFGQRVAHGLLVVSIQLLSLGLLSELITSHHEERTGGADRAARLVDEVLR